MTDALLPFESFGPKDAKQVIIWMHGLGADGFDFVPMAEQLKLPDTRWIFPHAPSRPITINQGYVMPGWFDILSLTRIEPQDEAGMMAAREWIVKLIEHVMTWGYTPNQISLGGFSQGAVMALLTGLSFESPLKSIVACSGYLPMQFDFNEWANPANANTPIFMCHGVADPVLPFILGETSAGFLKLREYPIQWHAYSMAHEVCSQEVRDLKQFLE